jgi:hypothetical protein
VAGLLARAHQGPAASEQPVSKAPKASKRDLRVAARTRSSPPSLPASSLPPDVPPASAVEAAEEPGGAPAEAVPPADAADVVPLPVFDAREEARRWW